MVFMIKEKVYQLYGQYGLNFRSGFHLRKPKLLARLVANYMKLFVGKGPLLRTLDIAINWECNLSCEHCFTYNIKDSNIIEHLDVLDYKRIAEEARDLGAVHIAFQGGEPLLYPKLEETLDVIDPWGVILSITTNGTLLSKKRIFELYKMGVDHLTFSIDSGIAREHDIFRGVPGTFSKAMSAVKEILDSPMGLTINTMVTHKNLGTPGLNSMLDFVKKNKIKLNIVLPAPIGRWEGDTEHLVTEEDKLLIKQILRKYPTVRRDLDANYWRYGCGAAKEVIYISPEGNVLPCPFIHASLGNVKHLSLKGLRERALKYKVFSNYNDCCLAAEDTQFIQRDLSRCWGRQGELIDIDEMMRDK